MTEVRQRLRVGQRTFVADRPPVNHFPHREFNNLATYGAWNFRHFQNDRWHMARAGATANRGTYLGAQGIDQRRFSVRGFADTEPVASNATPEGRAQNRRVEIYLVPITRG